MDTDHLVKPLLLVLTLTLTSLHAAETRVELDPNSTKVNFTLGSLLHTVHGTFKLKKTDLWFDAASGKAGGNLVVDATSGETGNGSRDSKMHKSVLESAKYPDIAFVPDQVQGTVSMQGDSDLKLHGSLSVHGAAHEVTMNVKCHIDHDKLTGTINFPIPYVKWGMKNPSTLFLRVDETVQIEIVALGDLRR